MIEDVYRVMMRINSIRERFGLNARADVTDRPSRQEDYSSIHKSSISAETILTPGKKPTVDDINGLADRYGTRYRVPPSLVKAVIGAESDYNPEAVSPKGALGLMQLMPAVADELGVEDPFSPEQNVEAGTSLLSKLLREYNGDYKLALSAYNAGKGAVEEHNGVPDYPETQAYVKKVIESYLKNK